MDCGVEVGDEGVGQLELVRREDEPGGPTVVRLELAHGAVGAFHGTHHGRADGHHLSPAVDAAVDGVHAILRDDQLLAVDLVLGEVFDFDFAEGAEADVQCR